MSNSVIFPEDKDPNKERREFMLGLISIHPVAAFQILNKLFNKKGLCLRIEVLDESLQSSKQKQEVDST